jgi:CDP-diacylglycerol--glycerol-3-phosphate 3-phosphatidyltransferase
MRDNWFYRNVANLVTILRFSLCFVLLWLIFYHREQIWAIFWLAAIGLATDWLDGLLARRLKIVSKFGAAADRLADKFLQLIMFSFFILDQRVDPWVRGITYPLAIIEIGLFIIWAMGVVKKFDVAASKWGKVKTLLISVGIVVCLGSIVVKEIWKLEQSSFLVPALFIMFAISLFFGAMSLTTHVSKYRSQLS